MIVWRSPFRSRFLLGCFLVRVSYTFVAVIEVLYVSALTFVYEVDTVWASVFVVTVTLCIGYSVLLGSVPSRCEV